MDSKRGRIIAALLLVAGVCSGTNCKVDGHPMKPPGAEDEATLRLARYVARAGPPQGAEQVVGADELVPQVGGHDEVQLMRFKRQLTVPRDSPLNFQGPQPAQPAGGSFLSTISELGTQINNAKALSSLFSPSQQGGAQQAPSSGNPLSGLSSIFGNGGAPGGAPGGGGGGGGGFSMEAVMRQLAELNNMIKSTQERNARTLEATQRSAENVGQDTLAATRTAQGGIQQALTELGQGLSRIAANNPSLLTDIRSLYQSVASRLSSATSSVGQAAQSSPLPINSNYPALPTAQSA